MENKKWNILWGILLPVAGWFVDVVVFALISGVIFPDLFGMALTFGVLWLILGIISVVILLKKGKRSCLIYNAAALAVTLLLFGGCFAVIRGGA
jgi:uncharacterized membrane protein